MLHEIWMAETKAAANKAFDLFLETCQAKYPKAAECLAKDRAVLLTFYDFPAEHWSHIRTTNPIESTFAGVRLRTDKTKGSGTRSACLAMVFKLAQSAEHSWRTSTAARCCRKSFKASASSTESRLWPPDIHAGRYTGFDNTSLLQNLVLFSPFLLLHPQCQIEMDLINCPELCV